MTLDKGRDANGRGPVSLQEAARRDGRPSQHHTAWVARVAIADVEGKREELLAAHFSCEESEHLADRPAQTVAGFLAVKDALCEWVKSTEHGLGVARRDFVLSHNAAGAVEVLRCPHGDPKDLRVSVTHTREWAYGLVTHQEVPA